MRKLLALFIVLSVASSLYAQPINRGRLEFTEEDLSPSVFPYQVRFSNSSLTDNNDGTVSIKTGSQTPWTSNIDGGNYSLSNVSSVSVSGTGVNEFGSSNFTGDVNVDGNVSADYYTGNGSLLTGIAAGYTNLTQFTAQTPWRVFYSNATGQTIELALGALGTYLYSNGAEVAPTWETPAGSGDMTKAVYDPDEDGLVDALNTTAVNDAETDPTVDTEGEAETTWGGVNILLETEIDASSELLAIMDDETGSASGSPLLVFNQGPTINGATLTGVIDGGGATSVEIPNTAGDVTCDAEGEIAVDSTQKQLAVYDGTEIAIPLRHMIHGPLYLTGAYDIDTDYPIIHLDTTVFPDGIVITGWSISSTAADPTTELDANLMYCDDIGTGAFPGANPVLIDVLDTTTGNASCADMSTSDLGSGIIPADKVIYIDMDADPTDTDAYWILKIEYYIPES